MWGLTVARVHHRRWSLRKASVSRLSVLPPPARVVRPMVPPAEVSCRRPPESAGLAPPLTRRRPPPHARPPAVHDTPALAAPRVRRRWALSVPAVHRRVLDTVRALDNPTAFRKAFSRPLGPPFLAPGTPERDLLDVLAAASVTEAERHARRLDETPWLTDGPAAIADDVVQCALGRRAVPGLWGDDAATDALRVRLLRSAAHDNEDAGPAIDWSGFLRWAAPHVQEMAIPEPLVPVAATAVASADGYVRAFAFAAKRFARRGARVEAFPVMSTLALRCAIAGEFRPEMASWLVPWGRLRAPWQGAEPFAPLLLAHRAYRDAGTVGGVVHLTAALVAVEVRRIVAGAFGRDAGAWLRKWRSGEPPARPEVLTRAVALVRDQAIRAHRPRATASPWTPSWGGPGPERVLDRVWALLGQAGDRAYELFLDDRLAVAAVYASHGYAPSAHALLAAFSVPDPLLPAAAELRFALDRAPAEPVAIDAPAGGPEIDALFAKVAKTPDPSVALGSPWWRVKDARGPLLSRLMAEGRVSETRAVRTLLAREDLIARLKRFWVLRGTDEDDAALEQLALRLAARERPRPAAREWLRFVEDRCRRAESRTGG